MLRVLGPGRHDVAAICGDLGIQCAITTESARHPEKMAVLVMPNGESGRDQHRLAQRDFRRVRHPHEDPEADTGAGQPDGILEVSPIQRATRARGKALLQVIVQAQEIERSVKDAVGRTLGGGIRWMRAPTSKGPDDDREAAPALARGTHLAA